MLIVKLETYRVSTIHWEYNLLELVQLVNQNFPSSILNRFKILHDCNYEVKVVYVIPGIARVWQPIVLWHLENALKASNEISEEVLDVELVLKIIIELIDYSLVIIWAHKTVNIFGPPVEKEVLNCLLIFLTHVFAIIERLEDTVKHAELVSMVVVGCNFFELVEHLDKVAENVGEDGDTEEHEKGDEDPLWVGLGVEVTEANGSESCEGIVH